VLLRRFAGGYFAQPTNIGDFHGLVALGGIILLLSRVAASV